MKMIEHLIPGRADANFEQALTDQLSAVLFSEGERRPLSTEGVNDFHDRELRNGVSVHLENSHIDDDYLIGDDRMPARVPGVMWDHSVPPDHIFWIHGDVEDREQFEEKLASGFYQGRPTRLALRATVRVSFPQPKVQEDEIRTYSFYKLNPSHFAPVFFGRWHVEALNLPGTIRKGAELMISGPSGIISNPREDEVLQVLKQEVSVDVEKYDAQRAQIAEEQGLNIRPYAATV